MTDGYAPPKTALPTEHVASATIFLRNPETSSPTGAGTRARFSKWQARERRPRCMQARKNTHRTSAGPGVRLGAKTRRRQHPRKPAGQPAARLSDRARRGLPLKIAPSRMASRPGSCRAKRACQNLSAGNTCVAGSSLRGRQRRETMGRLLQQGPPARPLNRCARALSGAWSLPGASFKQRSSAAALRFLPSYHYRSRHEAAFFASAAKRDPANTAPRIHVSPSPSPLGRPAARRNKWVKRSQRYRKGAYIPQRATYLHER